MKKYIIIAVVALVANAACTKVQNETPDQKISFNAATYVAQTKSDPATNHSLNAPVSEGGEGVTAFKSKAFLHAAGSSSTQNMFGANGETVSYNSSVPEWAPANEYFWPKSAESYINFVSWYTTNDAFITPANVSESSMSWGTSGSPITITGTDNILFAEEAWNYKSNTNNTTTYANDGVTTGVPTLFHHALAKLAFNVKLATKTASSKTVWEVDINTVTLTIQNNGYLALTNADPHPSAITAEIENWKVGSNYATSEIVGWTAGSSTETIVETGSSASNVTKEITLPATMTLAPYNATSSTAATSGDYQSLLAFRTVMPQTLGSVVKFGMTFTIRMYHANESTHAKTGDAFSEELITIPATTTLTSLVTDANFASWKMNTKVTYNITIDPVGDKITFDPAVVDWANNSTADTQVYPQS